MTNDSPSITPELADDPILEIIAHLGAALIQSSPSDDAIIIQHVRGAYHLAIDLRRHASRSSTLKELGHAPI